MLTSLYKALGISLNTTPNRDQRAALNQKVFDELFRPKMKRCPKVILTLDERGFLWEFAVKKVEAKGKEWGGKDDFNREKREYTGACVEYAALRFYGLQGFFDDSINTKSSTTNRPDFLSAGVIVDTKGSYINNVPLVYKTDRCYEWHLPPREGTLYKCGTIIGVTNHETVWLLGIASPEVLDTKVDDNLIKFADPSKKSGFYGVEDLMEMPSTVENLKAVSLKMLVRM